MTKKIKKCIISGMIFAGLIFLIYTLIIGIRLEAVTIPPLMAGGSEMTDSMQQQDPNCYSFFVMGDTKTGTETMESIFGIIEHETPAFVIILGDFASKPTRYAHQFFVMEVSEYAEQFPILVVPGNHDTDIEGPFTMNDFESWYGPVGKSFHIGNDLFVILNNIDQYNAEGQYIDFLEKTIKTQAAPPSHIFVFMHIPPAGLNIPVLSRPLVQNARFLEVARKYRIDYVFCGDHHGYLKTNLDGTNFIISGGGGDNLRGKQGRFHHAVRMAVNSGQISETVIIIDRKIEALELFEQNITNYIWPFFMSHRLYMMGIAGIAIGLFFIRRHKRKFKAKPQ